MHILIKTFDIYNDSNIIIAEGHDALYRCVTSDEEIHASLEFRLMGSDRLEAGKRYYILSETGETGPYRSETMICTESGPTAKLEVTTQITEAHREFVNKKVGGDAPYLQIQYTNYSATSFKISTHGANLWSGFSWLSQSPGDILRERSGRQTMAASQNYSSGVAFNSDIWLCWAGPGNNFGVWTHFNYQLLGLGDAPVWYVSTNGSNWALSNAQTSKPYTWDVDKVGYRIVGTPTAGHSSLFVDVVIQDR